MTPSGIRERATVIVVQRVRKFGWRTPPPKKPNHKTGYKDPKESFHFLSSSSWPLLTQRWVRPKPAFSLLLGVRLDF